MKARAPVNSHGKPWAPGDRWSCDDCGASGDDRDDRDHPSCPKSGHKNGPHLGLLFVTNGVVWRPRWSDRPIPT